MATAMNAAAAPCPALAFALSLVLALPPARAQDVCPAGLDAAALQQLNALRERGADCGERGRLAAAGALAWQPLLASVARQQAEWMADHGTLIHTGRGGETLGQRAAAAGYRYARVAENLAQGQTGVAQVLADWTASPGHCANLYDADVTEMALACAPGADGRLRWALILGRRL